MGTDLPSGPVVPSPYRGTATTTTTEMRVVPEPLTDQRSRVCKLGRVLDLVGAGDAALILNRMADPAWTDRGLSHRLEDAGIFVTSSLFSLHRNGNCICRPAIGKG